MLSLLSGHRQGVTSSGVVASDPAFRPVVGNPDGRGWQVYFPGAEMSGESMAIAGIVPVVLDGITFMPVEGELGGGRYGVLRFEYRWQAARFGRRRLRELRAAEVARRAAEELRLRSVSAPVPVSVCGAPALVGNPDGRGGQVYLPGVSPSGEYCAVNDVYPVVVGGVTYVPLEALPYDGPVLSSSREAALRYLESVLERREAAARAELALTRRVRRPRYV